MEARDGAAGDGDEEEGEEAPRKHRSRAVDEARDRRHFEVRPDEEYAQRKGEDRADLQESGEIVAGREQEPNGQHRGDETVGDQHEGQRLALEGEERRENFASGDEAAERKARHEQGKANERHLAHMSGPQEPPIDTHQNGDGKRGEDGEGSPRAIGQGSDHDEAQHSQQDHHDRENADHRDEPRGLAHLRLDQIAERAAVAARRDEKNEKVLHRAREDDADDEPERAGKIAHLRREHRADKRPRAGDRREVMAEEHIFVGRHIIESVGQTMRGGRTRGIDAQHPARDEGRIETEADQIDANRRGHEPERVDALAARDGERVEREQSGRADSDPERN